MDEILGACLELVDQPALLATGFVVLAPVRVGARRVQDAVRQAQPLGQQQQGCQQPGVDQGGTAQFHPASLTGLPSASTRNGPP